MQNEPNKELDPSKTILVCKHNGKEVGRISAVSPKVNDYLAGLAQTFGELEVEYIEDKTGTWSMLSRIF